MNHQASAPGHDGDAARQTLIDVRHEVMRVVVGHDAVVSGLVTALLIRGHVLLAGAPGTAKTLLVTSLAGAFGLPSRHLRVAPKGAGDERPGEGLLLVDDVDRQPAEVRAVLSDAMQPAAPSAAGAPVLVVATQQPDHPAGPALPPALLDRFLFQLRVGYPTEAQEREIVARHDRDGDAGTAWTDRVRRIADTGTLDHARRAVRAVAVDAAVGDYVVALARASREAPAVRVGASPRATAMLLHAAKAWAWLAGGTVLTVAEVRAVAKPVLRHRLYLRPEAQLDGVGPDDVVDGLLSSVPAPR